MRCLILGLGSAGRRHHDILRQFPIITEIHAVSRQSVTDIRTYASVKEAIKNNRYDYYIIASATANHESDLKILLRETRTEKILVEKPLFHRYIRGCNENARVFVGYNLRFHPAINKIREELKTTGSIYYAGLSVGQYLPHWRPNRDYRMNYSAKAKEGGGVLLDLSHEIDLLHHLFGEINKVTGLRAKKSNLEIDSEDIAVLTGETKQGIIFSINLDYLSYKPVRKIMVHTESKTIEADLIANTLALTSQNGITHSINLPPLNRDETYRSMHESLLLRTNTDACTMHQGLRINYWIDQLKKKSIIRVAA